MNDVRVVSHVDEVKQALEQATRQALTAIGMAAETNAKKATPVDTGRLRNSMTYATAEYSGQGSYSDNKGKTYTDASARGAIEKNVVVVGTNVEYAEGIELGTHRKRGAAHMVKKGMQGHQKEFQAIIKQALENS